MKDTTKVKFVKIEEDVLWQLKEYTAKNRLRALSDGIKQLLSEA